MGLLSFFVLVVSFGCGWAAFEKEEEEGKEKAPQELANFGLSGKLAKDQATGNVYKGVVLKVNLPT